MTQTFKTAILERAIQALFYTKTLYCYIKFKEKDNTFNSKAI